MHRKIMERHLICVGKIMRFTFLYMKTFLVQDLAIRPSSL